MSFSAELTTEFSKRTATSNRVYKDLRYSQAHHVGAITSPAARSPLSHPQAAKLVGKALAEQVKIIMADRCHFLGEYPQRRVMNDRCKRVISIYTELKALKYEMPMVTSFGLRHAMALLDSWKSRNLSRKCVFR